MKKILSILLLILLFIPSAFAQQELSPEELLQKKLELTKKQLRPPEWILGHWADPYDWMDFVFKERDVIMTELSMKDVYADYIDSTYSSDDKYSFTVVIGETIQTYRFDKISDTQINYTLITNGEEIGPIELGKK